MTNTPQPRSREQLLKQQNRYLAQLVEGTTRNTQEPLTAASTLPLTAHLWWAKPEQQPLIKALKALNPGQQQHLETYPGVLTALAEPQAAHLQLGQRLSLITCPGAGLLFSLNPQVFAQGRLLAALNSPQWVKALAQPAAIQCFSQPKWRELLNHSLFVQLVQQSDLGLYWADAEFLKAFDADVWLELLQQPAVKALLTANSSNDSSNNSSSNLSNSTTSNTTNSTTNNNPKDLFNLKAFAQLLQRPDFTQLLAKPPLLALCHEGSLVAPLQQPELVRLLRNDAVCQWLAKPYVHSHFPESDQWLKGASAGGWLQPLCQAVADKSKLLDQAALKLLPEQPPKLAFWMVQNNSDEDSTEAQQQLSAIKQAYSLAIASKNPEELQHSLTAARANTLILPQFYGRLPMDRLYQQFLALGGRIISQIDEDNLYWLNRLTGWNLSHASHWISGGLTGQQLKGTAPAIKNSTGVADRNSLPSNAQVFLYSQTNKTNVAGAYIPYGLGEVILIGYDWEKGSDTEWDALLHGLIEGTALPYQRRYPKSQIPNPKSQILNPKS